MATPKDAERSRSCRPPSSIRRLPDPPIRLSGEKRRRAMLAMTRASRSRNEAAFKSLRSSTELFVNLQIQRDRMPVRLVREADDRHEFRMLFRRHALLSGGGAERGNAILAAIRHADRPVRSAPSSADPMHRDP